MELISHQRMLTAIASGMVGPADADDIVQETFLRALARPPADPNAPIAPWLVTVAKNLAVDLLRHRGRFVEISDDEGEAAPLPPESSLPMLLAGLGRLTPGEVAVLLLRDGMDLDVDEVSKALDTSPGSVRVLHHRARTKAAKPAPLDQGLKALDHFLTWLLSRAVAGVPIVGVPRDPGVDQGVLVAHLALLDAMIEIAHVQGDPGVEGRARLSRGSTRSALGRAESAIEDLELAIALGANRTIAEARLAPLLFTGGQTERALETALSGLARGDEPLLRPTLHRVAVRVYIARGDIEGAEPHVEALRSLGEKDSRDAGTAFANSHVSLVAERFAEAHEQLLLALGLIRDSGNTRNELTLLNNLAFTSLCMGELAEASAWCDEAMALAKSLGALRGEATCLGNRATIAQLEGRFDEAEAGFSWAIALCSANELRIDAELLRMYAATVSHQVGRVEQAARELEGIVHRMGDLHGLSLQPRIQLLAALAELGRADANEFEALSSEAATQPSLVRALSLYRLLLDRDAAAIAKALAEPAGTAPAERVARSILGRIATTRSTKRRRRKTPGR